MKPDDPPPDPGPQPTPEEAEALLRQAIDDLSAAVSLVQLARINIVRIEPAPLRSRLDDIEERIGELVARIRDKMAET